MYRPASFRLENPARIAAVLARHPFATVVVAGPDGMEATPVPLLVDEATRELVGHVARANPLAKLLDGRDALAIFSGPHAYVSPRWYVGKENVPTWNYVAVHVTGKARTFDDGPELRALLSRLVETFEAGADAPWRFELEEAFTASLAKAIVGFRIPMTRVEAKAKLSQNREPEDARGARAGLEASADVESREVAAWMRAMGVGDG